MPRFLKSCLAPPAAVFWLVAGVSVAFQAGCDDGQPLGAACETTSECMSDLQCLNTACVPRCAADVQCGEGFLCSQFGECEVVVSVEGDKCRREQDCGPGLACVLGADETDLDADGFLDSACSKEYVGSTTGNECTDAHDCRNGTCIAGLCTQICLTTRDCPALFECAIILLDPGDPLGVKKFRGCYPGESP